MITLVYFACPCAGARNIYFQAYLILGGDHANADQPGEPADFSSTWVM